MSAFISELLSQMSRETQEIIPQLDVRTTAERALDEINKLNEEMHNTAIEYYEKEINARMILNERDIKMYKHINKQILDEINNVTDMRALKESVGDPNMLKAQLDSYKKMLNNATDEINVCSLIEVHTAMAKKKQEIALIEKRLSKYSGLPPNISQAKEALNDLSNEIRTLEMNAERNLADDVSKYLL